MIEVRVMGALVPKRGWRALARRAALAALRAAGLQPEAYNLTIVLSDDDEIASLNLQFRGVEGPTDVLAFGFTEGESLVACGQRKPYLGDVIVSLRQACAQASAAGHSPERELALLVAHGVLHLLGYDHSDEQQKEVMWRLQEKAAAEVSGEEGVT